MAPAKNLEKKLQVMTIESWMLSIFSHICILQPFPTHQNVLSHTIFNEDSEWDTMKAQVMARIDMILKPATISYANYSIQFPVPCYSPQLMLLNKSEKYTYMVEYALKAKSGLSTKSLRSLRSKSLHTVFFAACDMS